MIVIIFGEVVPKTVAARPGAEVVVHVKLGHPQILSNGLFVFAALEEEVAQLEVGPDVFRRGFDQFLIFFDRLFRLALEHVLLCSVVNLFSVDRQNETSPAADSSVS